jgi:acetyltransferase-like isoleucine patch superfamily enzyme
MYLWRRRERAKTIRRFVFIWAKRVAQTRGLVRLILRSLVLRHQGAVVGTLAVIGRAKIYGPRANLVIGQEAALGRCSVSLNAKVEIGARAVVNDGATILTASHSLSDPKWRTTTGSVRIGEYAWIATNALLLPGVNIGRGAVVAAGAVITHDVPAYACAVGNPARILPERRTHDFDYSPALMTAPIEAWLGRPPLHPQ